MKSKLVAAAFAFALLTSCMPEELRDNVSNKDVGVVLQEFTKARIQMYFYGSKEIPTNKALMQNILVQRGINPEAFFATFKEKKPAINKRLFNGS